MNWVHLGGDLIVAFSGKVSEGLGGTDDALLPVSPAPGDGSEQQSLRALERVVPNAAGLLNPASVTIRRVVPKPGARGIAGSPGLPLIVRGHSGAGRVTYLAFPLAALRSCWNGPSCKALLAGCVHQPREDLETTRPPPLAPPLEEVLLNMTEALPSVDPPSGLIMGPLLILYVALVAPLNYVLLTRLGKKDYTTPAALIVAVIFGAMFYGIGWYYKGTRALVARAAVVELAQDPTEPSRIDGMTGFFSTERGVLDGEAPKGACVAPIAEHVNARAGAVLEPAEGTPSLKDVELDTWALRRFRTTRPEVAGSVVLNLQIEDRRLVGGTVENKTKWVLESPMILVGNQSIPLADMRPGQKLKVQETLMTGAGDFP